MLHMGHSFLYDKRGFFLPNFFLLLILEHEEKGLKSNNKKWYLHLPNQIHCAKKSVTFTTELVAVQFRGLFMSFHRVTDHSELEQACKDH